MKRVITKLYYIAIILILLSKVGLTLFSNGLAVHHGKKIAHLQVQRNNLLTQQLKLTSELSEKSSIASISEVISLEEYSPISKPIIISQIDSVASN